MALQPVSAITPLRAGNVAFNGRRDSSTQTSSMVPSSLKAVPVIVLMAMSPLNNVNASGSVNALKEANGVEVVSYSQAVKKPKVIETLSLKSSQGGYTSYKINRLDLDGNPDTFEALEIIRYIPGQEGVVSKRGIVTSVFLNADDAKKKLTLSLHGVGLSTENLDDYTPQTSPYSELKSESYNQGSIEDLRMVLALSIHSPRNNDAIKFVKTPRHDFTSRAKMVKKLENFIAQ